MTDSCVLLPHHDLPETKQFVYVFCYHIMHRESDVDMDKILVKYVTCCHFIIRIMHERTVRRASRRRVLITLSQRRWFAPAEKRVRKREKGEEIKYENYVT